MACSFYMAKMNMKPWFVVKESEVRRKAKGKKAELLGANTDANGEFE